MARPYTKKVIQPEQSNPADSSLRIAYLEAKLTEANQRVEELESKLEATTRHIELLNKHIELGQTRPGGLLPNIEPAIHPSEIPDDDPTDPRPEMHPTYGWRTGGVIEWAGRQIEKRKGGE